MRTRSSILAHLFDILLSSWLVFIRKKFEMIAMPRLPVCKHCRHYNLIIETPILLALKISFQYSAFYHDHWLFAQSARRSRRLGGSTLNLRIFLFDSYYCQVTLLSRGMNEWMNSSSNNKEVIQSLHVRHSGVIFSNILYKAYSLYLDNDLHIILCVCVCVSLS